MGLICPRCNSDNCRRSRRHSPKDILLGFTGLRPWRCRPCERRFYGWSVPVSYIGYAHCSRCGNLDLQRVSGEHVTEGWFLWPRRLLHFPAYRCEPCRYRFFSLRPYRRIEAVRTAKSPPEPAGGALDASPHSKL